MPKTLLCLASYFKGTDFLVHAKRAGATVILLTREKLQNEAWPHDSIDEIFFMPDLRKFPDIINGVSYLARHRQIDQIIPLDDYDVLTVGELREHMRLPGLGSSGSRYVRDKLAMRQGARNAGILVPDFIQALNHPQLAQFMANTPVPWLLKPRGEAGAMGIKRINHPDELWGWLDILGDDQSNFLLERFIPGDVYHIDSIVWKGRVKFASPHKYGAPPLDVAHDGGVFVTRTLPAKSDEGAKLLKLNKQIVKALGMVNGAMHTEFIRGHEDGRYYFVETAGRVGGAGISELVEQTKGLNLWGEWSRVELAALGGKTYKAPKTTDYEGGLLVCLAKQDYPDYAHYNDPEVAWTLHKKNHAGIIVRSENSERVQALIDHYTSRFAHDFLAVAPPLDTAPA